MFDRAETTAAGGDYVFYHYHALARCDGAFDHLLCAVFFGLFANDEAFDIFLLLPRNGDDRRRDWIGADGHASDGIGQVVTDHVEHAGRDDVGGFSVERQFSTIEIEAGFLTGGEGEVAKREGVVFDQLDKSLTVVQGFAIPCRGLGSGNRVAGVARL